MADPHLSNDEFFTKLAALLADQRRKGHGSLFLTQKRLSYGEDNTDDNDAASDSSAAAAADKQHAILIRATNGNPKKKGSGEGVAELSRREREQQRVKFGTVVQPAALDAFFQRYAEVARAGMVDGLRKRDRSRRKKKRKEGGAAAVPGAGGKK